MTLTIDDVLIPERDTPIKTVVGPIVVYTDNTYVAVVRGALETGRVPKDGHLTIGGNVLKAKGDRLSLTKGGEGIIEGGQRSWKGFLKTMTNIVDDDRGIFSMHTDRYTFSNVAANVLRTETYELPDVRTITFDAMIEDLTLALNNENHIAYRGEGHLTPTYTRGTLTIPRQDATISIPKTQQLALDIETKTGAVKGDVRHGGRIETKTGKVDITLTGNVAVKIEKIIGDPNVYGMLAQGELYVPPNKEYDAILEIETATGDIRVAYER